MSSVGTVVAQRPIRGKNFVINNAAALMFPATSVEAVAPVGAIQVVGGVITFPTLATAISDAAGTILNGSAALSAGLTLNGTATGAIAVGQQLRDMGRYVTVLNEASVVFRLALVQLKRGGADGQTEGVNGAASNSSLSLGYNTFYILIDTNLNVTTEEVGAVGVARV